MLRKVDGVKRCRLVGPRNHVLDSGRDPLQEIAILWVVRPIEKLYESVLRHFTQHKINNGDSGTAGNRLQCSRLVAVILHAPT